MQKEHILPRAAAIICEYNPFHRGHAYQLAAARRDCNAEVILCVMSEQLTQRGEFAIADAYIRAEAATRCGADLVVSLPFPWSGAAAEYFAAAGVFLATALGASHLHFGSECGDLPRLQRVAEAVSSPAFSARLIQLQHTQPELGVMEARDRVLRELLGCESPDGSNDLLALAYLCAIREQCSPLIPVTISRSGQAYRDDTPISDAAYASASALRRLWREHGVSALQDTLPPACAAVLRRAADSGLAPVCADRIGTAAEVFFRRADAKALSCCAELGGGLAQRLISAAREGAYPDISAFIAAAATKRFTNARIARAVWYGMCGVQPSDLRAMPAYTRLLACNDKGKAYLRAIRKSTSLPIVTKPADLPTTPSAVRQGALEQALTDLYTLALPTPRDAAYYLRAKPFLS
ncbi:MAG: nucleotidyltransferase family protein [Clostridia bacterium]|nr:nucleotidyltransferase family protein [Clostridia bacterium]